MTLVRRKSRARNDVNRSVGQTVAEAAETCAGRLARFFPGAVPVRIPIQVTAVRPGPTRLSEATVVEYNAGEHVIFPCALPLEFDDRVRIERAGDAAGGSHGAAEAAVAAVQYHEGNKAVAVRFLKGPCEWVTEP